MRESTATGDDGEYGDESNTMDSHYDIASKSVSHNRHISNAGLIFARAPQDYKPQLKDFSIMKMVGRGTFGKVYMVQNQFDGNIYAMKCIRKDIILDND